MQLATKNSAVSKTLWTMCIDNNIWQNNTIKLLLCQTVRSLIFPQMFYSVGSAILYQILQKYNPKDDLLKIGLINGKDQIKPRNRKSSNPYPISVILRVIA